MRRVREKCGASERSVRENTDWKKKITTVGIGREAEMVEKERSFRKVGCKKRSIRCVVVEMLVESICKLLRSKE